MPELPASCTLAAAGAARQAARYAHLGETAVRVERRRRTLAVELSDAVDERVVRELIAVERECCPFLELGYDRGRRRFSVAVDEPNEPALAAIEHAIGRGRRAAAGR
jgi:hypothetical protein